MSQRLELLHLRKEALILRGDLARIDLAQQLIQLRRPAELGYQGLKVASLLRVPLLAFLASRIGAASSGGGVLAHLARYTGYAVAGWRFYRGARELMAQPRPPAP